MKPTRSRALLGTAVAAALAAVGFAGPAQANTTLPGLNGKIAFTTNADIVSVGLGAEGGTVTPPDCLTPPVSFLAGFGISCDAEIETIDPDGQNLTQVTNNSVPDDGAAWLPTDGSSIAYQSSQGSNCDPESGNSIDCHYSIFTMSASGAGQTQRTHDPANELNNETHPSYSPAGDRIAYETINFAPIESAQTRLGLPPTLQQLLTNLFKTLYVIPAAGDTAGAPVPLIDQSEWDPTQNGGFLVSDSQPAWSPDGTKIAFTRMSIGVNTASGDKLIPTNQLKMSTYVVSAAGGASHEVDSVVPCDLNSGEVTAVASRAEGYRGSIDQQSSDDRGITGIDCTMDVAPAWSPDGSKIAVERIHLLQPADFSADRTPRVSEPGEDADIVVLNAADGTVEHNLSDVAEPECGFVNETFCSQDQKPAWSPDGSKIAFYSDRGSDGLFDAQGCFGDEDASKCDNEIYTMNADGSGVTQLTNNDVEDVNPDWQRIPPPPVQQPTPPAQPAVKPKVGVAGVRRACVSKAFHVRFRIATSSSVKSVVVKLDGHKIKSTKKSKFTLKINSKKLRAGRHRLTITAIDSAGQKTVTRKTFSVCKAAKPRRHSAPRFTG